MAELLNKFYPEKGGQEDPVESKIIMNFWNLKVLLKII